MRNLADKNIGTSLKAKLKKLKNLKNDVDRKFYAKVDRKTKRFVDKTIVIDGFWRSGTTWVQSKICKSISGKSIFEPFFPEKNDDSIYSNSGLTKSNLSHSFLHSFLPFIANNNESSQFQEYLQRCLVGDIESTWARRLRTSVFSSFQKIVVCKFVRGHLLLPYFLEAYPEMPVIHIYRNPKPIITSIRRNGWGGWFDNFYLHDHFININDGRIEYFEKFRSLISKYDKMDVQSRICAFWCLSERFMQDKCLGKDNFLSVSYEDLSMNGFNEVKVFLSHYGFTWKENHKDEVNSDTTDKKRKSLSKKEKRESWRNELDYSTQMKIDSIIHEFELNQFLELNQ